MDPITIVTMVVPGLASLKALMMANSLRCFGGTLSKSPIWWLIPEPMDDFTDQVRQEITRLKIKIQPFQVPLKVRQFPFGAKVFAASHAEFSAMGVTELLAWLDMDNIILSQPDELLLPAGKLLAYRPVHHRLIGPAWDEPLDAFWELVNQTCMVPEGRQFPMVTHTGEKIRPYFNAGTFVTRPGTGLMAHWQDTFLALYQLPQFQAWYQKGDLYAIFIHQAIFTGVILQRFSPDDLHFLSPKINYPLHLHSEVPEDIRPVNIHDLISLRYENIFDNPDWLDQLPFLAPILDWLSTQPLLQQKSQGTA